MLRPERDVEFTGRSHVLNIFNDLRVEFDAYSGKLRLDHRQHGDEVRALRIGNGEKAQRRAVLLTLPCPVFRPAGFVEKRFGLYKIGLSLLFPGKGEIGGISAGRGFTAIDRSGEFPAVEAEIERLAHLDIGGNRPRCVQESEILITDRERLDRQIRIGFQTAYDF
ncbi:hypothetical protein D3C80_1481120 [compost metagenome]